MTTELAAADAVRRPAFSRAYRGWLLVVLLLVNALNLADRQGLAISAPAIKHDLGLSDTQLGVLQGLAFAIFFTLLALPIARLAEHWSRTRIVAISVAVLGGMLALCGTARGFAQFLLCRIGVGVGDAGFGPPAASLIGDHYPQQKRASVNALVWLGAPLGAISGSVIGGWFAQTLGWRMWFFALALPAFAVALAAFFTLRDPPRGMSDRVTPSGAPPAMTAVIRFLWAKRSFRQILIGAGLASMPLNALGQFFARYFVSNFHLGLAETGRILGLMAGTAMASGMLLGGFGVDWAGRFDRRWYVRAPALALLIASPLFVLGVAQPTVTAAVLILLCGHIALFVFWTPTLALAQNMVGANMRASAAFVANLVIGLVGIGLGPTLVGILSDAFAHHAFQLGDFAQSCPGGAAPAGASAALAAACRTASATGVRDAIMTMSLLFAWAALHYLLASRHLERDLDTHYAA
jgi:predicted MFS family arabinose efflux permease